MSISRLVWGWALVAGALCGAPGTALAEEATATPPASPAADDSRTEDAPETPTTASDLESERAQAVTAVVHALTNLGHFEQALEARQELNQLIVDRFGADDYRAVTQRLYMQQLERGIRLSEDQRQLLLVAERSESAGHQALQRGDFERAMPVLQAAGEQYRTLIGEDTMAYAGVLLKLGHLYRMTGNLAEAERVLTESVRTHRDLAGVRHPKFLDAVNDLGLVLVDQEKYVESEQYLAAAVEGRRVALGEDSSDYATSLVNLGVVYLRSDRLADATTQFERAQAVLQKAGAKQTAAYAVCLNNLGILSGAAGSAELARDYFQEALDVYLILFSADHPKVQQVLRNYRTALQHLEHQRQSGAAAEHHQVAKPKE